MGRDAQEGLTSFGCHACHLFGPCTLSRTSFAAYPQSVRGADLIREARLRAGLTQAELSKRTGRERSVIARWEQGAVSPSFDNMLEVIEACGFELPLVLVPRETALDDRLEKNLNLSPERRAQRLLGRIGKDGATVAETPWKFDPYGVLRALDRHRVSYVTIGGFARVVQGTEEITRGVDIVPSTRPENLRRLEAALEEIGARADGSELALDEALT